MSAAPMDIRQATRSYEAWLAAHTPIVRADLALKHRRMTESPFVFLRGTFYRWIERWPDVCADLRDAPLVLAVGDLHVENFGTWRDVEGRLVWGVNDVDEACRLPYTQDLVRLATSATLAIGARHFSVPCARPAERFSTVIRRRSRAAGAPSSWPSAGSGCAPGAERPARSGGVLGEVRSRAEGDRPRAGARAGVAVARAEAGVPHAAPRGRRRQPRPAAIRRAGRMERRADRREAKAAVPSALAWAAGKTQAASLMMTVLRRAVRVPDPFFGVRDGWIVRRLAPDCTRVELARAAETARRLRLLRAMDGDGERHLGSIGAHRLAADLARRPARWLERAATTCRTSSLADWRDAMGARRDRRPRSERAI